MKTLNELVKTKSWNLTPEIFIKKSAIGDLKEHRQLLEEADLALDQTSAKNERSMYNYYIRIINCEQSVIDYIIEKNNLTKEDLEVLKNESFS